VRAPLLAAVLGSLALVACGGASRTQPGVSSGTLPRGDALGVPSLAALPASGIAREDFSERMTRGWDLAKQSFAEPMPAIPSAHDSATLTAWSERQLATWLRRRTELVDVARRELDGAAEESSEQRIAGGAIVGLMYEDVGRALLALPMPQELELEPEIAAVYRDVIDFQASPWVEHARLAYRACRENARIHAIETYAEFCADRGSNLPAAREESRASDADLVLLDSSE
jgi:hypothetical protein